MVELSVQPSIPEVVEDPVSAAAGLARLQRALFGHRGQPPRLARYLLVQRLSAGGMGVVYRAYDPQLDRQVAIKLIEADSDDPRASARRLTEAHALAALSHPHVVRIFDVGTYDAAATDADPEVAALLPCGGMFLVLELVEGPTLGQWASAAPRHWRAIRDAFVDAGRGLEAAHAAGLVHHDFKPDNAVLGADGRVRVLDFGLARQAEVTVVDEPPVATAQDSTTSLGPVTRAGPHTRAAGTPMYMAPEQHDGGTTGPASDQFAFCVALFEALFGRGPFLGDDVDSLARTKQRGEIEAPPRTEPVPSWLYRALLRGLSPDPAGRWPSMGALLRALHRDRTTGMRRRWSLATATVAVVTAAGAAWAVRPPAPDDSCDDPSAALDGVWDGSRRHRTHGALSRVARPYAATTADKVSRRLDDYGRAWLDRFAAMCTTIEPHDVALAAIHRDPQLMDLARDCMMQRRRELDTVIDTLVDADPAIVDHAAAMVSRLRPLSGCTDPAQLAMAERLPVDPTRRQAVEHAYADLVRASTMRMAGRRQEAVALAEAVRERADELGYPPLRAEVLRQLAQARIGAGDEHGGVQQLRESIGVAVATNNHRSAAKGWIEVFFELTRVGAGLDAALELQPVVEQAITRTGDDDLWLPWLNNLGAAYLGARNLEMGEQVLRRAEASLATEADPFASLRLLGNLAVIPIDRMEWDLAEERLLEVLTLQLEHLGPDHPDLAISLQNLSWVAIQRPEPVKAREYATRLISILDPIWGEHPAIARAHAMIAESHYMEGDLTRARTQAELSLAMMRRLDGSSNDAERPSLNLLADLEEDAGRPLQARHHRERLLVLEERARGKDHPHNWLSRIRLATLDAQLERDHQARVGLAAARAWFADGQHTLPVDYRCWMMGQIGETQTLLGDMDPAIDSATGAVECGEAARLPAWMIADQRFNLARALLERDRPRALALAREAASDALVVPRAKMQTWIEEHDTP